MNDVARARPAAAADPLRTYRRLLGYVARHRSAFAFGVAGAVLYSASTAALAYFGKQLGDDTFTHPNPRIILWLPVALVLLFTLRGIGDFTQTWFMGSVSRRVVSELRQEVFERILRLPLAFFDRSSAAALLSKLTYNTEQVGQASTDSIVVFVSTSLLIVFLIGELLWFNWRLALVSLAMGPLVGWLVTQVNRRFRRYGRRIQDSMGDVTRVSKEAFESPRLIKVYNAEAHLAREFHAVNEHNRRSYMRLILTKGLSSPIIQVLTALGAAFVFSYAIASAIHGQMTTGDLLGFLAALGMIPTPLKQLIGVSGPMQQGIAAAQSLFEVLDTPPEPRGGGYAPARVRGDVELDRVSFSYASSRQAALREVSLKVKAGEQVAIVGRSGSGKSTLVSLLPRFYDAVSGAVRIDGHDVREFDLQSLRDQIGVVSQEIVLFDDTIRSNIAFGREMPQEAIERAADAAHVLEFVRDLPKGLDTFVGDRGVLLSGGQRQRIAIARALLKDAPILILDEATSALDTEAERHIQAALAELVRNRTTFVIAHRLSTVEQADRIVVLESGRIAEIGTHAELIAADGPYAQLHRLQFKS
ncbi:MAG TPA: lipid A export permease/ATP-binding protein MsbA [Steroidobacteraceae bacterium]|nr:lipid A export permease/ATP-binding protein MsbA [Steroidobacteraceae bacterium]